MSSFYFQDSDTIPHVYSRKEKSLGLLCCNFLTLYGNKEGIKTIELDDAASQLGVERRRMYDVVNILESLGIVARKGKNQYSWKGFGEIPGTLEELKEEGLKENFNISVCSNLVQASYNNENGGSLQWDANSSASSKTENRRDKSLVLLSQNFLKLFLCSDVDTILLDDAAKALPGDNDLTALRTKVRRLYDIANVFSSVNLIEKTHRPVNGKPAYRWLGWKQKPENRSDTAFDLNEPKKRMFGSDITNCSFKRNKVDSSMVWKLNQKANLPMPNRKGDSENVHVGNKLEQHSKHSSKDIVFGPFAPVNVPRVEDPKGKRVKGVQDWESLSSTYRPQCNNQALSEPFAHYMEAWKSWFGEVSVKQQMQQTF